MSEEEIIQEIEKLELEEEKEKTIKYLLKVVIEGKKDIIQEKEFFIEKKEKEIEELKEKQDYARLEKEQLLEDSISKDKIIEKIRELEKRKKDLFELEDDCARSIGLEDCYEKLILYNELLEE